MVNLVPKKALSQSSGMLTVYPLVIHVLGICIPRQVLEDTRKLFILSVSSGIPRYTCTLVSFREHEHPS